MNATELREHFLQEHAEEILRLYRARIDGQSLNTVDMSALDNMWQLLQSVIKAAKDKEIVETKSTSDIMQAVSKGRITVDEAKELMHLLKLQKDIDSEGSSERQFPEFHYHMHTPTEEEVEALHKLDEDDRDDK